MSGLIIIKFGTFFLWISPRIITGLRSYMKHSKECDGCPLLTTCSSREDWRKWWSSYTSVELHDVVFKFTGWIQLCRLEKCISVGRSLENIQYVVVRQKGRSNQLSSRTSRTSGHKHCRVDKELQQWRVYLRYFGRLEPLLNEMQFHNLNESYDSYELTGPGLL